MTRQKMKKDQFIGVTWDDLYNWAGSKIVSRGKDYQKAGRVSDLAVTEDGGLLAWVKGTETYATNVYWTEEDLPESICTCPYELDCKHGVAVVLEYLDQIETGHNVPMAKKDDRRLHLLKDTETDDELDELEESRSSLHENINNEIEIFLKGKTKTQLIELIFELTAQYPKIAQDLMDHRDLISGNTKALLNHLRREIREIGEEPGWRDYWQDEGYTPDYSGVRKKMEALLRAGYADEVVTLGKELITIGTTQVGESDDEGETAMEISSCLPVIIKALDQSSLSLVDKLTWAVNAVLEDEYNICEPLAEYLMQPHPKQAWSQLADQLINRLNQIKPSKGDDFHSRYKRNRISDWAIQALENGGRKGELIPLCESEAKKSGSYDRLVRILIEEKNFERAEQWIHKGIRAVGKQWPGITSSLREKMCEIRVKQKNWPQVAVLKIEEFVRHPSTKGYEECRKAANRVKVWPKTRECILNYLEEGVLPWVQKDWPLPPPIFDLPEKNPFKQAPMIGDLIDIAILEKNPDRILHWYDQRLKQRYGGYALDEDRIAIAVQDYAPERAVEIWKRVAESLIAQVKPKAYREAATYLRKAGRVMSQYKKEKDWTEYLQNLREVHIRKIRLIEILDGLEGKPILKKKKDKLT